MSPEEFLNESGHLAETEGGVEKLRRLGLHLAVRGKMGTGRSTDPSAASLLEGIADRRAALANKLGARPSEAGSVCSSEWVPKNWVEVPLGIFGVFLGGGTPSKSVTKFWGGSIPWVTPKDMKRPAIDSAIDTITEEAVEGSSTKLVPPGAILMVLRGMILAHSFPVARTTVTVTINQDMKALVPIDAEWSNFLLIALQEARDRVLASIERSSHGTCRLDSDVLLHLPVWLPPLPEQKRIVEKVDQLMALCDELEAKQKEKRAKAVSFNQAALSAVVHAPDKSKLKSSWSRVQDHFEVLYELPENVKELRQTILQLAVMGKLVEHDDDVQEVVQLEPTGSPFHRSVEPFDDTMRVKGIPRSWSCTRFGFLADVASGLTKGRKLAGRKILYLPYLRVANVQRGWLDLSVVKDIEVAEDEVSRYVLEVGDVLLTEGGDADKLGRSAIWRAELPLCLHQNHVFRARPSVLVRSEWLSTFTNSPVGRTYFLSAAKQTTNLASINMTQLRNCPIPLPSLREQDRILNKVQQFMSLCDDLEAKLAQHRHQGQRLMQAVVEGLVA